MSVVFDHNDRWFIEIPIKYETGIERENAAGHIDGVEWSYATRREAREANRDFVLKR